jgi:hypothetical protein
MINLKGLNGAPRGGRRGRTHPVAPWTLALVILAVNSATLSAAECPANDCPVQFGGPPATPDCIYYPPPCDGQYPLGAMPVPGVEGLPGEWPQGQTPPDLGAPSTSPEGTSPAPTAPGSGSADAGLPGGLGAVAASESPGVHMIGDFFGSGYFLGGTDGFATVPGAGGDRRFKATDNLSPLPQDRVFFNYHHFHNAVSDIDAVNRSVDRFTFGYEKTCLDQTVSFEVRVPFASGLDSAQSFGSEDTVATEFGNIALTVKALLWQHNSLSFASGLATVLPVAEDASVEGDGTFTLLENNAVHLQPYVGVSYANPCRRLFSTAYLAVDFDANGNALSTGSASPGFAPILTPLGDVRDQTLLFVDWQLGYWLYQDYGHIGYLNGIAPVIELHYSQALEDPVDLGVYTNPFGRADLLNLTAGLVFDFRRAATVTVYGAAPLRREEAIIFGRPVSPVFQAEFGVQAIYRY